MRILIVDDDAHVTWALKLSLERAGHEVESAADGNTALNRIRAQAPDVLVTDINMPYVNGDELAAAVQSEFPDRRFPIFVMSSMSAPENRTWISQIPGAVFIPKPLRTRDLIARLAAYAAAR